MKPQFSENVAVIMAVDSITGEPMQLTCTDQKLDSNGGDAPGTPHTKTGTATDEEAVVDLGGVTKTLTVKNTDDSNDFLFRWNDVDDYATLEPDESWGDALAASAIRVVAASSLTATYSIKYTV